LAVFGGFAPKEVENAKKIVVFSDKTLLQNPVSDAIILT
jgi:hypothetical protein